MNKKIAIITLYNPEKWSWAEKVAQEVWLTLSKHNEIFFIFSWKNKEINKRWKITYISLSTPSVWWINFLVFVIQLNIFLKEFKWDVIIDNIWWSAMYLLLNKKTIPLISIIHWATKSLLSFTKQIVFKNYFEKIKYYWFLMINDILTTCVLKKSDLTITLSKYISQELVTIYWIPQEKIKVIYNWYDNDSWVINKHNSNKKLQVLFISNDHARKWISILEEIAVKCINENICFYIVGEKYTSEMANIVSLGKIQRENLYTLMWESDVIFLPSYYEWQPLVILEAMHHWCIPIISQNCHMDMLENTVFSQYINQNNDTEIYYTMFKLLLKLNKSSLFNLQVQAQECIKQYTRKNQTQQYVDIINWL